MRFVLTADRPFDPADTEGDFMRLWVWNEDGEEMPASAMEQICGEREMTYTLPMSAVTGSYLDFKAADSRERIVSPEDFYDHGDVLPLGYARYRVILR